MNAEPSAPLSVLVVDDSVQVRRRLCALLAEWPRLQVVAEASDGVEALAAFHRCEPRVVVLDIQLPGLTGVEVLRQIKAAAPTCVVVMLTSFHPRPFHEVCVTLGAQALFNKAQDFETVPKYLDSLAERVAAPATLNSRPDSSPATAQDPNPTSTSLQ